MPGIAAPAKTSGSKLYQITCDPNCGFMVKDHNKNEIVEIAMMHGKMSHPDMKLTKPQVEGMIKTV